MLKIAMEDHYFNFDSIKQTKRENNIYFSATLTPIELIDSASCCYRNFREQNK